MGTAAIGNATEAMVLGAFVERDFSVSVPFGGGHPYDLVVDLGEPGFLRVQCKTAWSVKGCMVFNARSTDHGRGPQPYHGLADVFGVYFPPRKTVYLVPVNAIPGSEGRLRLLPTLNNQRKGIRFAAEFEFDRWSDEDLRELMRDEVLAVA
ncbi:MAG TPA: group I intron-associated PD-(D/E)XK endonuclease [Solirubrobacterales bacterium]|nr:group I intron-associated PD-(D/E)XK endonuclease [Solirubrobacterales bacterium]